MVAKLLPGSFTKQFAWGKDPERLHRSIRAGFWKGPIPVSRDSWREHCGLNDRDIDLIPICYFLYTKTLPVEELILIDTLVEFALRRPHDQQFAKLSVFSFHLANSGYWRGSDWPDGQVAGWANSLIRNFAWSEHGWRSSAFEKQSLMRYLEKHIEATSSTCKKVRNNYRFMLEQAGMLIEGAIQPTDVTSPWAISAPQLFWDRQIFDGRLSPNSSQARFEELFMEHEIFKLLNCSPKQGLALAKSAYRDYTKAALSSRGKQLDALAKIAA